MSSRKPKPGAVPGLCENQARSKVSNGQRKRPQDWQEGHPSSQAVITITTNSSSVCSEHARALLQQPQLLSQGEKPGSAPCSGNIALLSFWIQLQLTLAWQQADPTPSGLGSISSRIYATFRGVPVLSLDRTRSVRGVQLGQREKYHKGSKRSVRRGTGPVFLPDVTEL